VEAFHGGDWYTNERYTGPTAFPYPPEWDRYLGRYRSYSPWMNNFRIVVRKGQLLLQWYGLFRRTLTALPNGSFRVGDEAHSPERLRFDAVVDGQAWRANLSGGDYYRVATP
jgi:hypothetical protein